MDKKEKGNPYWPCLRVEYDDYSSIVLSDFQLFDNYFGEKGGGGYSVQRLAKRLVEENELEGIRFDSEAGMFCAFSSDQDQLIQLCSLFRTIVRKETDFKVEEKLPQIPLDQAEKLLLKGFVFELNKEAQETFLKNVPYPGLSAIQAKYLEAIVNGTPEEKIQAVKKVNSEARTRTRNWKNYLSHPETVCMLLEAIDRETDTKVYQELIWALVFICLRHLPDLRAEPYFTNCLSHSWSQIRILGIQGLCHLTGNPSGKILSLTSDKSDKVRKVAEEWLYILNSRSRNPEDCFAGWMFDRKNVKEIAVV